MGVSFLMDMVTHFICATGVKILPCQQNSKPASISSSVKLFMMEALSLLPLPFAILGARKCVRACQPPIFSNNQWKLLMEAFPAPGMLIIWDRMFGTYRAETVRRSNLYGLAGQPNTFDVFQLNLQHIIRMTTFIKGKGKGEGEGGGGVVDTLSLFWHRVTARRVKHPLTFSLAALFEP